MKRILISQRVDVIESYSERRDALDQRWSELLWEAGCLGLPVPNHRRALTELLKVLPIDGILLTGGNSPVEYGGLAQERDETDELLISFAVSNNTPLLGVCRGMQSIVLYFGGTLRKVKEHVAVRHEIIINNNLHRSSTRNVNSYHEYSPDKLPDALTIFAQSMDDEIEYLRHKNLPIAGIMWHPEREIPFMPDDIELFNIFVQGTSYESNNTCSG